MRSKPWVNYALITANVIVFILTYNQIAQLNTFMAQMQAGQITGVRLNDISERFPVYDYYLFARNTQLYQFFTYMFLHNGWLHIIGNMVFLFAFGNNVEDRLGKVGYLGFFLAGGVIAGLGNQLWSDAPVLGASGAVCAVTGAYLALFPKTNITLIYWWFIVGSFEVRARDLIIFFVVLDTLLNFIGFSNVAYTAHLSGYLFGFGVMMLLLWIRLLPREPYDMIAAYEQYRRRRSFKRMTDQGYSPWESTGPPKVGDPPHTATEKDKPLTPEQQQIMDTRGKVSAALNDQDMPTAAQRYLDLLKLDDQQVMSRQHQLDLANQLMAEGNYVNAAIAYELLLRYYPTYPDRAHVHLILALIYVRYLQQPTRGRELLEDPIVERLNSSDAELAKQVLAEVE